MTRNDTRTEPEARRIAAAQTRDCEGLFCRRMPCDLTPGYVEYNAEYEVSMFGEAGEED